MIMQLQAIRTYRGRLYLKIYTSYFLMNDSAPFRLFMIYDFMSTIVLLYEQAHGFKERDKLNRLTSARINVNARETILRT
jgi:hypothetical protein